MSYRQESARLPSTNVLPIKMGCLFTRARFSCNLNRGAVTIGTIEDD